MSTDIPRDCHEGRSRGVDGPMLIDLDGAQGHHVSDVKFINLDPFLVSCDLTTFPHVGVTKLDPKV